MYNGYTFIDVLSYVKSESTGIIIKKGWGILNPSFRHVMAKTHIHSN